MSSKQTASSATLGEKAVIPQKRLDSVKKILVCQLRQLGDVVLSTPSVELLKKRFPMAQLDFFTEKKCLPLLENNPNINKIWPLDKEQLNSFGKELGYYWGISRQQYDLIVDFQQLPRSRWISLFSPGAIRLTYTPPWYNRILYSHWSDPEDGYAGAYKASVLRPLGIEWNGEAPRIYLTDSEKEAAAGLLCRLGFKEGQTLISLDITQRHVTRCWPTEHFAKLVTLAVQACKGLRVLPVYGPGERGTIEHLVKLCDDLNPGFSRETLLLPEHMLSLRESAAAISHATLHLGTCSAPRHMAVAVGTPSLGILGAGSNAWTFPSSAHRDVALGLDCQPCNKNSCPIGIKCLKDLQPEQVLPQFIDSLQDASKARPNSIKC